jgi:hypothetical protein
MATKTSAHVYDFNNFASPQWINRSVHHPIATGPRARFNPLARVGAHGVSPRRIDFVPDEGESGHNLAHADATCRRTDKMLAGLAKKTCLFVLTVFVMTALGPLGLSILVPLGMMIW